ALPADHDLTAKQELESAKSAEIDAKGAVQLAEEELKIAKDNLAASQLGLSKIKQEMDVADQQLATADAKIKDNPQRKTDLLARQKEKTSQLPALRQAETASRETMDQAQTFEDRAKEDQFRKEVRLAHTDPDTYVPGKVESIDAVTQVSI